MKVCSTATKMLHLLNLECKQIKIVSSGLCPRAAALLRLPGTRHRVLPEAPAGDAKRDAAAGGAGARDHGGRGQQGAAAPRFGQQGARLPGDEDPR